MHDGARLVVQCVFLVPVAGMRQERCNSCNSYIPTRHGLRRGFGRRVRCKVSSIGIGPQHANATRLSGGAERPRGARRAVHGRTKAFRKRGCVRMQRLGTGPEAGSPARCSRCGSGAHERMRAWRVLCKDEGLRSAYLSRGGPLRRTAAAGLQSTVWRGIGHTTRIVQHVRHDHVQRCDTVQHVAALCTA